MSSFDLKNTPLRQAQCTPLPHLDRGGIRKKRDTASRAA